MPKLLTNPEDITLSTQNEVNKILGRPPGWLLQWGISLVFLAVLIIGILAWFIKYPDVITAEVRILTEHPAIRVVAPASGKINRLLIENNQTVEADNILAILDNPADYQDVITLDNFLTQTEKRTNSKSYLALNPPTSLELGPLQNTYAGLVQKINNYQYFLKRSTVFKKIDALEAQIDQIKILNGNLKKQRATLSKEISLVKKDFDRNQKLVKEGIVSDLDLEQSETQFLQYERQLDGLDNQVINNKINIEQLNTQILDLKSGRKENNNTGALQIQEDVQRLKSEINAWQQTYLVRAPISGKIAFSKNLSPQQFIQVNEELLTIVPENGSGKIIGKAIVPLANAGKIKPGQVANIRLNAFPFQEYGLLKSRVQHISLVPVMARDQQSENYLLDLSLTDSLTTTYEKQIPFRQEMLGTANIITEDRRVIERVFEKLNGLLER